MCSVNMYKLPQTLLSPDAHHQPTRTRSAAGLGNKEGIEVGNKEGNNKIIHFVAKAFYCFYGKVFMVFIWAHSAYNFVSRPEFPVPQSY